MTKATTVKINNNLQLSSGCDVPHPCREFLVAVHGFALLQLCSLDDFGTKVAQPNGPPLKPTKDLVALQDIFAYINPESLLPQCTTLLFPNFTHDSALPQLYSLDDFNQPLPKPPTKRTSPKTTNLPPKLTYFPQTAT
jgi:hypothetical protein